MKRKKVLIVGGGLGGLQCGYILAKNDFDVTVLEQNKLPGGYIQSYKRGKTVLDTGFHYIGGLDEGKPLHKVFDYMNLLDLPWQQLDDDIADEIIVDGKSYYYATGIDNFGESLKQQFTGLNKEIDEYCQILKNVGDMLAPSLRRQDPTEMFASEYFTTSAYEFLKSKIKDERLIDVLSGASLKMELNPETLPLYVFAQVNSTFIQSSWRLRGGGMQIAEKLISDIEAMGGKVVTGCKVLELIEKDGMIVSAITDKGTEEKADFFISNAHPSVTLDLIKDSKMIRNLYRKRVKNLPNTYGMFTTSRIRKENSIKYENRNIFKYEPRTIWQQSIYRGKQDIEAAMVSIQVPEPGNLYTRNIDILTPMHLQELEQWKDTSVFKRGQDYEDYKQQKANQCIDYVSDRFPGLKDAIEKIYTSTPLTYRDYCGIEDGTAYGIRKDCNNLMFTMLTPKTPVKNLFMTGQSLMIHGVLGVTMTSLMTCMEIIDKEKLLSDVGL